MSWTNPPTPKAQFSKYELWNYFRFFSVFSYIFPSSKMSLSAKLLEQSKILTILLFQIQHQSDDLFTVLEQYSPDTSHLTQSCCLLAIHTLCFGAFSSRFAFFDPKLPKTLACWRFTLSALAHFPLPSSSLAQSCPKHLLAGGLLSLH